jgi:regulator of replication initiation timing
MGLFKTLGDTKYIDNMIVMSKTNLSLLNTLNELQSEYEKVIQENNLLKNELSKFKR